MKKLVLALTLLILASSSFASVTYSGKEKKFGSTVFLSYQKNAATIGEWTVYNDGTTSLTMY